MRRCTHPRSIKRDPNPFACPRYLHGGRPRRAMQYAVEVQGALAFSDHTRTYLLKARSEDEAARDGLEQFVTEMRAIYEDD